MNFSKSKVFGVGVHDDEVRDISTFLKCDSAKLPFTYLGVTVGANMGLARNWKPVIYKVSSKLSSWKANIFSFGGRVTLCKSVLGSIPLYFLSLFKAPDNVIESLEKLRRRFLWGASDHGKKKIHWVEWNRSMAPKHLGGLGIGSLKSANVALLSKWWWRIKIDRDALWSKVITTIHGVSGRYATSMANPRNQNSSLFRIGHL